MDTLMYIQIIDLMGESVEGVGELLRVVIAERVGLRIRRR